MHMKRLGFALVTFLFATTLFAAWRAEGPFVSTIVDVASDPSNSAILYAATDAGGVWRSDDGGQHWMLPGDAMVSRPIQWIVVDPATSSTIWAGVHNPGGAGLWRSADRGKTWSSVRPDKTSYILGQPIAFALSNPSIVYAPSTNLHYRSADGGKTWESFRVPDQDAYAFGINPKNPKIIYAGGRGTSHQMRRSADGGKTWQAADEGLPDQSVSLIAIPREHPSTVYAMTSVFGELFKTDDEGKSWTRVDVGTSGTEKMFSLDLDPHDPQVLFVGTENGLRKSSDGGDSWSTVGGGLGNWFCKGVAFDPKKPGTVYAGTTGNGFFKSTDGGESFEPSNTGLGAAWVKRLYAPAAGGGPIFAQTSVGLYRQDAPNTWVEIQAPFDSDNAEIDGIVFDRVSPKRVFAHKNSKWWHSEDSGRSWQQIEVPQPGMRDMMKGKISGPEFQSLAQDLGDPKIFYCGGSGSKDFGTVAVNRSNNSGKKWEAAGAGIDGTVKLLRPAAPGTLFAVTDKGIYRTGDGGKSWSSVHGADDVRDLAVDLTHPERAFIATKEGLYRTTDNGATWMKLTKGIKGDGDEVESVVVSPTCKVFCATFEGVFVSADGGDTFTAMNEGLMNTDVRALAITGGSAPRLYAGLAAGSVYSIELP
jgi:photosystem II stability/assembly factor-like uncharacterized protein